MLRMLVLLLVLAGCAEVPPPASWSGTLDVSALPDEQQVIASNALADWRLLSGGRVTAQTGVGGLPVRVVDALPPGEAGLYDGDSIRVFACDTTTPAGYDACYQVIAHEIGHWLGAQHVAARDAVMWEDCTGATVLTEADRAALDAVVGQ